VQVALRAKGTSIAAEYGPKARDSYKHLLVLPMRITLGLERALFLIVP
jgi:hypothetical protein